jgi:endonuclease/exonuclease/phosphatase family metal-dependent hydrolase
MGVTIGTLNILDPIFAVKHKQAEGLALPGMSNWSTRKIRIEELIQECALDVICLQEVSSQSLSDMKAAIKEQGYKIRHVKHSGRHDGLAILYKKDKLEEKEFHSLSKHGINSCYIDLCDKTNAKMIRVANCHLLGGPHTDKGTEQIEELVAETDKAGSQKIDLRIIAGDFNTQMLKDSKFTALQKANYAFDGNITPTEPSTKRHIDWIWVRSSPQIPPVFSDHLVPLYISQSCVSDHILSATQIKFKAAVINPLPPVFQQATAPLVAPTPFVFKHSQPKGSLREKIMDHFSVTGPQWPDFRKSQLSQQLDQILTQYAKAKPFLPTIRQKFAEYGGPFPMSENEMKVLKNDLERAIAAALQLTPKPVSVQPPEPTPKPVSVQPPKSTAIPLSSPPAAKPKAPLTFGQKVKAFFDTIFRFFTRIFTRIFG